ncbi:metal ABC transporter substrate-binding protein [Iamia majanohamensis]|uniref:Metal ABC transporter substrate-binding protein n=1 Tax=Iamia majanohamensis TaxID=467976 RepID=A0AAE9Y3Q8_9ACTN|nr:metal ABC transporter substrate-binding protein [Iamia majanohamensis]WCO65502.1 metal ABC transporter substrate-binding protein [Iamia majanohamensis]
MRRVRPLLVVPAAVLALAAVGCGSDDGGGASGAGPTVAVTTSLLGDVVEEMVGDQAEVVVLMPPGADPHQTSLSAQQAAEVREADALVTNGGGFEEGMLDGLEAAESDGVPTYEALEAVEPLEATAHAHEDGEHVGDEEHADEGEGEHAGDEEHADEGEHEGEGEHAGDEEHAEGEHDHGDVDPHFFTDPARMAVAAEGIAEFLGTEVPALDTEAFRGSAAAEVAALEALDAEVEDVLAAVPAEDRKLVTNHEVFGYFADRYGFEVVGAVVPGGSTGAEPSAGELDELASTLEAEGVPAIFADVSSPESLSDALASEVGDVEVVALYTESLGEEGSDGETYDAMVRTNAERIVDALT